jgi:para-aminobenzoate synthetase / 4-amino-4-deoxychorismate lyase
MPQHIILHDARSRKWLRFAEPVELIEAHSLDEVLPKLRRLERLVQERRLYAAGFISYEAAPAFDPALQVRKGSGFPLLWFGLYPRADEVELPRLAACTTAYQVSEWSPTVLEEDYHHTIARIKEHIARGDSYQVNYTFRLLASFAGDPWALFGELVRAQEADYPAFVDTGRWAICSASPELFFHLNGSELVTRPMKGTASRGRTMAEDETQARWLYNSEKNRAENVMIVDMLRNDMGRVAEAGTVQTPRLFDVERYPTVWQMTSTVTATTHASIAEIMSALFPCASITGAPKPRTMQIIATLERTPRYIYTGTIGYIAPNRVAQFNVAIRTVLVDRERGAAEYGVGGGIVWDSNAAEEYGECQVKARVLHEKPLEFNLLESLLWEPGRGYFLLERHLERLREAAIFFAYPVDMDVVVARLEALPGGLMPVPHKVRLVVARSGAVSCETLELEAAREVPVRVRLATEPVDSGDRFLYHKTTNRRVYERARAARPEADDVLLWNERGEVTESTIANLVVQVDRDMLTPPVDNGLLPGVFRGWLLDQGVVRETVVTQEMLRQADRLFLINSVRRWREAVLLD